MDLTQEGIPLPMVAQTLGLTWSQAWHLVLQQRLAARKVKGRWFVDPESFALELQRRGYDGPNTTSLTGLESIRV